MKCKLCDKEFTQLGWHLKYKHNMTSNEYKLKFKVDRIQDYRSHSANSNRLKKICPYCNKFESYPRGLSLHIMYKHPDYFDKWKELNKIKRTKNYNSEYYKCAICGKKVRMLIQHVLWHEVKWDDYCVKYSWDPSKKYYYSEQHKKHSSENKIHFYNETSRGDNLKREQSIKISGSNNPACREEVRQKISMSYFKNGPRDHSKFGTFIKFKDGSCVRSQVELKFKYALDKNNIEYNYESVKVVYEINNKKRIYVSDFVIKNDIIELKCDNSTLESNPKYESINERLNKIGYNFYYNNPIEYLKLKDLNYSYYNEDPINIIKYYIDDIALIRTNNKSSRLFKDKEISSKIKINYFGKKEDK